MEFHGLSRKELQALCKRNKIPANMTNVAMADALAALPEVEGLGEILNQKEAGDIGTPAVQPRTASRATTQRKAVKEPETNKVSTRLNRGARSGVAEGEAEQENKDANVPVTPAVVPTSRRRAPAVSTRRKKEVIILDDEGEDDKNEVDEKNEVNVERKTPAVAPRSRTRAAGRSVRDKTEISDDASLQNAYSTRRSVRVLGKSLSKISLVETEGMEQQTKSEDVSEEGASLQTESNEVSQKNDEGEISSVNKADRENQSHDSGSEAKSADAEDVLQAEPEVEGSENVNHVEAAHEDPSLNLQDSFETCVDSNEAESKQPELEESEQPEQEESGDSAAPENVPLEIAPEEAPLEVADQPITVSTGDISMEVADQEDVTGLSVEASEEALKGTAEEAVVGLSVEASEEASKEISPQAIASSTVVVSDDADQEDVADLSAEVSEEAIKETAELAIVGLSVESSEEASKESSRQTVAPIDVVVPDDEGVADMVFEEEEKIEGVADMVFEEEEKIEGAVSAILADKDEEASKVISHQAIEPIDVVVPDDACVDNLDEGVADMVFEKEEKIEGAVSDLLAEKDEASGKEESNEVEKVILKLSMLDVAVNPELEGVAQINDQKTNDIAVESVAFEQIKEDPICSAQTETKENLKTIDVQDMSMRSLKKLLKSGTKEIANDIQADTVADEIQAVTNVESGMNNPNIMKENPKNIDVQNMSMRGLKKLLKEKLDGKLAMTDNDGAPMQGVEKKRTALQALPQNQ